MTDVPDEVERSFDALVRPLRAARRAFVAALVVEADDGEPRLFVTMDGAGNVPLYDALKDRL